MIPASALLQEAARYSRTLSIRVDIYHGSTPTHHNVPVTGGTITADRTSKIRLNADVQLAMYPWEATGIDTRHCSFAISRGVESLGYAERMPMGRFRVDDLTRSSNGQIALSGSGRETYLVDARFITPRTPPLGASTSGEITSLILEVLPRAVVRWRHTADRKITATAPWHMERRDAIDALAESIGAQVYSNYTGEFVIANIPNLNTGVPVYRLTEGNGGLLVERTEKDTRDQVYNAVSVSGQSSDPNTPPVWGWAYDADPNSETYYYADPDGPGGGFGRVPRFYTSQFFSRDDQCVAVAKGLLAQSLAANKSLTFSTIPLAFLEVEDLVQVTMSDGSKENHLLTKSTCTLGVDGGMSFETISTKVLARNEDDPDVLVGGT